VADVKSSNRYLAAVNAGQKHSGGDDDAQGDCYKYDDGFPSHERNIKAEEMDVNVKF
jgi:hypothetical protein